MKTVGSEIIHNRNHLFDGGIGNENTTSTEMLGRCREYI